MTINTTFSLLLTFRDRWGVERNEQSGVYDTIALAKEAVAATYSFAVWEWNEDYDGVTKSMNNGHGTHIEWQIVELERNTAIAIPDNLKDALVWLNQ